MSTMPMEGLGGWMDANALPLSLGSQIAGILMRTLQQRQVNNARNQVMLADQARQEAFRRQAMNQVNAGIARFAAPQQAANEAAAGGQRFAAAERVLTSPTDQRIQSGEYAGLAPSAPDVVRSSIASSVVDALNSGRNYARTGAALGGVSDSGFQNDVALGRGGQRINQAIDFSRGSAGVVPFEYQGANTRGRGYGTLGDLFSGAGQLGMMRALTRRRPTNPYGIPDGMPHPG